MNPDPYASGDVGLIPGLLLIILALWVSAAHRRNISKLESKALLSFGTLVITLVLFPLYLIFGAAIIGGAFWASPFINYLAGVDLKQFVMKYIWVRGSAMSFVWTALIGILPSLVYLAYAGARRKFRARPEET
jgi:4-amino-4-deoxy-L-arabinose transferase-like glycosyltransferase